MARLTPGQINEIKRLAKQGMRPSVIARQTGALPAQVTYHTRDIPGLVRNRRGRKKAPGTSADSSDWATLAAQADESGRVVSQDHPWGKNRSRVDSEPTPPPVALIPALPERPADPSPTLDDLADEGATAVNIRRLTELRDSPNATVADQIRAADLLMKWQRGQEETDLNQPLTDDEYVDVVVTMLEEMDTGLLKRVFTRVAPVLEGA